MRSQESNKDGFRREHGRTALDHALAGLHNPHEGASPEGVMASALVSIAESLKIIVSSDPSIQRYANLREAASELLIQTRSLVDCIPQENPVSRRQAFFEAQTAADFLDRMLKEGDIDA